MSDPEAGAGESPVRDGPDDHRPGPDRGTAAGHDSAPDRTGRPEDRPAERALRSAAVFGLYALVLLGAVATFLAVRDAVRAAGERDDAAAAEAAMRINGVLEQGVGSLRGMDAVAVSGRVDPTAFRSFARGAVDDSLFTAIALVDVVELGRRGEFEVSTGITIKDTDGQGGFAPAEDRPLSYVVVDAFPRTEATDRVIGFDIASDPVRRDGAQIATVTKLPVLTGPIRTATGGETGLFLTVVIENPTGEVVGFASSGIAVDSLVAEAGVDTAALAGFSLSMDGKVLTGTPDSGGGDTEFRSGGHRFVVTADDPRGPAWTIPLLVGLGTVALGVAVGWAGVRDRRQTHRLRRLSRRNRGISELGRDLASAADTAAILGRVEEQAATILDAEWSVVVERWHADDPARVVGSADDAGGTGRVLPDAVLESMARRRRVVHGRPRCDGAPLTVRVRDRECPVLTMVSAPIVLSGGECVGAVAFGWVGRLRPEQLDDRSVAATTVAELAGRALERAVISEIVRIGAEQLSVFARALAAARTTDDVRRAVDRHVPRVLGVGAAELDLDDRQDLVFGDRDGGDRAGRVVATHAVLNGDGAIVGRLVLRGGSRGGNGKMERAVLATVADLVGQAVSRTTHTDQEHDVIVQLQQSLLPGPVELPRTEIAARYRPALSLAGLGGDFYDIVVKPSGGAFLVVGDITGHGPEAVAAMAELQSVVRHVLESGAGLGAALRQADAALLRRGTLASVVMAEVDEERDALHLVNAGHPYPVLRRAGGGAELLRGGHSAILGLGATGSVRPAEVAFGSGDLVVLYTDGLIERRDTAIDDSMDDLVALAAELPCGSVESVLDVVNPGPGGPVNGAQPDDDVAVLVARRR